MGSREEDETNFQENGIPTRFRLLQKDGLRQRAQLQSTEEEMDSALLRNITLQSVKEKTEKLQATLVEELEEKIRTIMEAVLKEVEQSAVSQQHRYVLVEDSNKYKNRVKSDKNDGLPEKQFIARNSLLIDLFDVKHIRTIYNVFIVILIVLFLNTAVYDLVVVGKLNLGFELIKWNFSGFGTVLMIWLCMNASAVALYSCFSWWATHRIHWLPNSLGRKCWDYSWLAAAFMYEIIFLCVPVKIVIEEQLPPTSRLIILLEQLRMMMKTYAFIRSNTPQVLAYKPHQSGDSKDGLPVPGFSKFLYFLFAPTLVYRNSYPRTKDIRWKFVVWHFMEVIGVIFYIAFLFERFLIPMFRNYGLKEHSNKPLTEMFIVGMFGSMMPATLIFLSGFYCLLHSWLNAFAQMLRFADRMFYKDWWNATSFAAYYRLWNIVVHDWLYTYIYKDIAEIIKPNKRAYTLLSVFCISAIFHEYILTFAFGFCYPMLFVVFGSLGVSLVFMTKDRMLGGNILTWLLLSTGSGILTCLYMVEWYARLNCPRTLDPYTDFFVPRSWMCTGQ